MTDHLRAFRELERTGVLLVSDAVLPSLAGLVAQTPILGSWWSHPEAHAIFLVAEKLSDHPEVLTVRLLSGKFTYVHRTLWPSLFAVAGAREPWQLDGLPAAAAALLDEATTRGVVRLDHLAAERRLKVKTLGDAARQLEARLLVYSESVHTESGSHAKQIEAWRHVARRVKLKDGVVSVEQGKKNFEEIAVALQARFGKPVRLPWSGKERSHPRR